MKLMKQGSAVKIAGFAIVSIAAIVGCSLGLDASLIRNTSDGGEFFDTGIPTSTSTGDSSPPSDSGVDAAEAGLPTKCAKDADCISNEACLTGRCDVPTSECVYDVCPTPSTTCSAAVCTNNVCGAPTAFKFASARITVPSTISCATPERCLAVVHPWAFVGTSAGVFAVPVNPAAQAVTVDGGASAVAPIVVSNIAFPPSLIVSSNDRVFVYGGLGAAHIEVAWFDVPKSPLVTAILAQSTFVAVNDPPVNYAFPDGNGNSLIVSSTTGTPAGILGVPFPVTVTETATNVPITQTPSAMSGTRLFSFLLNGAASSFSIVNLPGTAAPTLEPAIDGSSLGNIVQAAFATAPDGSVRMSYETAVTTTVPPIITTATAHVRQVLDNATATTLGGGVYEFDLAPTFVNPIAGVIGPIAWVNATQVLDAWAVNPNVSSQVQLLDNVKTAPKTLSFAATPVANVGVATSAGKGWAITNDSATAPTASLYYIDPLCAQ